MNILIVDDEEKICDVIVEYCNKEKYNTDVAYNGQEALEKINKKNYDLLVLDIMMPKMSGFELLKKLKNNKKIPTIILSAKDQEYDKLEGFELGIDDYITKPFSPRELIARIKAILSRTNKEKQEIYKYKELEINRKAHSIKINNKQINITPKEFEILIYLIDNKEIAISREELLSKVWGYNFFGDDRTVDTHIKMLRHNLKEYRDLIQTVRSIGYKFTDET